MANVNNPHGFRPLMRSIVGGPGAACMRAHKIVGASPALFIGDVVQLGGSGTKSGLSIIAAAAGTVALGVNLNYGAAATATDHLIIPGQEQVFEAQIDTIAATTGNQNCQLVATAGDASTKQSKHSLNSLAATGTHEFTVLQLWDSPDNAFGAYARVEVRFNQSQLSDQIAGV